MPFFRSAACAALSLAGAPLIVAPVAAATRTVPITVPLSARPAPTLAWSSADETFNDRRWRGDRRHHDGFDGGDLLTVLLIGGGIAAVTSAIGNNQERRRADRTEGRDYPEARDRSDDDGRAYDYRSDGTRAPDGYRDRDRETGYGAERRTDRSDSGDTDRAVDACSAEAARSGEVDEIFDVAKIDGEWRVKGDYRNGREFTCTVDGNGKAYVGQGDRAAVAGDDRYAAGQSPDFTDPR